MFCVHLKRLCILLVLGGGVEGHPLVGVVEAFIVQLFYSFTHFLYTPLYAGPDQYIAGGSGGSLQNLEPRLYAAPLPIYFSPLRSSALQILVTCPP